MPIAKGRIPAASSAVVRRGATLRSNEISRRDAEIAIQCERQPRQLLDWWAQRQNATEDWRPGAQHDCSITGADCQATSVLLSPQVPPVVAWVERQSERRYMAISLATSDSEESVRYQVHHTLNYTADSLLAVHVGCGSQWRPSQRDAISLLRHSRSWHSRVLVNPWCTETQTGSGSILHAHLLNVALLDLLTLNTSRALSAPSHFVLLSADTMWLRRGVEHVVYERTSSALYPDVTFMPASAAFAFASDDDYEAILGSGPAVMNWFFAAMNHTGIFDAARVFATQKHEGSFYPWDTIVQLYYLLRRKGPLGRLNLRWGICGSSRFSGRQVFPLPEEYYPVGFATTRLLPLSDPVKLKQQLFPHGTERMAKISYRGNVVGSLGDYCDSLSGTEHTVPKFAVKVQDHTAARDVHSLCSGRVSGQWCRCI